MTYVSKAECEKEFVDYILSVGLKGYAEMDIKSNTYYQFNLKNGETRHWTNMSNENLKRLKEGKV